MSRSGCVCVCCGTCATPSGHKCFNPMNCFRIRGWRLNLITRNMSKIGVDKFMRIYSVVVLSQTFFFIEDIRCSVVKYQFQAKPRPLSMCKHNHNRLMSIWCLCFVRLLLNYCSIIVMFIVGTQVAIADNTCA